MHACMSVCMYGCILVFWATTGSRFFCFNKTSFSIYIENIFNKYQSKQRYLSYLKLSKDFHSPFHGLVNIPGFSRSQRVKYKISVEH